MRNELKHFNPFHDVLGRFASARGGAASAASSSDAQKKTTYKKYSNDVEGRVKMLTDIGCEKVEAQIPHDYAGSNKKEITARIKLPNEKYADIWITEDCEVSTSDIKKDLNKLVNKYDTFVNNAKKDMARMIVKENIDIDEDFMAKHGASKGIKNRQQVTNDNIRPYYVEYRAGTAILSGKNDDYPPYSKRREIEVGFDTTGPLYEGIPLSIAYDPSTGKLRSKYTNPV